MTWAYLCPDGLWWLASAREAAAACDCGYPVRLGTAAELLELAGK